MKMSSGFSGLQEVGWNEDDDEDDLDSTLMRNELNRWLDAVDEDVSEGSNVCLDNEKEYMNKKEQQNENCTHSKEKIHDTCELTLPTTRLFSNDIRHNFARMFMNTFNSGDFMHVQKFLNTYMTRTCKVVAEHYLRSAALKFPPLVVTDGPRQFSHYLVGHFIQYPDMIMNMTDCRVITHPNWLGTKVEIDITTSSTKMCSLAMEDWVPAVGRLTEKYNEAIQENQISLKPTVGTTTAAAVTGNSSPTAGKTSTDTGISSPAEPLLLQHNSNPTAVFTPIRTHLVMEEHDPEVPYLSDLTIDSGDEILRSKQKQQPPKKACKQKRGRKTKHTPTTAAAAPGLAAAAETRCFHPRKVRVRVDRSLTAPGVSSSISLADILASSECMGSYIPEDYSRFLFKKAVPVARPLVLSSQGRMTLYLDEHNQLKQMHVQVGQTNR